jgi:hypothetical protein
LSFGHVFLLASVVADVQRQPDSAFPDHVKPAKLAPTDGKLRKFAANSVGSSMKKILAMAAIALLAAACGDSGGKGAMVSKCVKQGQSQKTCECIVDKTEKNVDKDVFRAMMLDAEGKTEESQKLMQSLPAEKQMSAMGALSALECVQLN